MDMVRLRVKELAKERGISMSKLSRVADVSYNTVKTMYRYPEHGFNTKSLERIAHALQVDLTDLFEILPDQ
jgi:DNA-binding Xre family transcriptional regulator